MGFITRPSPVGVKYETIWGWAGPSSAQTRFKLSFNLKSALNWQSATEFHSIPTMVINIKLSSSDPLYFPHPHYSPMRLATPATLALLKKTTTIFQLFIPIMANFWEGGWLGLVSIRSKFGISQFCPNCQTILQY